MFSDQVMQINHVFFIKNILVTYCMSDIELGIDM